MPLIDWFCALLVIVVWGVNFIAIKFGLVDFPPLLLGALRFMAVVFPAIFFIKRPNISFKLLLVYGLTISFGQFAFLFTSLAVGMPAGVASLLLQVQAFFTVLIAALVQHEKVRPHNLLAIGISMLGLFIINTNANTGHPIPVLGLVFIFLAALSWATGNIVIKQAKNVNMLSLVVWGGTIPIIPFLLSSWIFEGGDLIVSSLQSTTFTGIAAIMYLAYGATLVGYVLWGRLLAKHPVGLIAPLTLLVPVVGLLSASWILEEKLSALQWLGGAVVMLGLVVNIFGPKLRKLIALH
ncbi:EamA family transporter [Advenella sp. RU8]|uniref:EamA family transporter n=1 Tax=Advenella sp. RU8 TaxID=3399575 RepID=UPI003AAAE393